MSIMNPYKDKATTVDTEVKSTRPTAGLLSGVQTFGSMDPGEMKKRREGMAEMREERKAKRAERKAKKAASKLDVDDSV